ncbi:hypothetical protein GGU11DRAFT_693805, partial [Lentinula aff. detonsa]
EVLEWKKGKAIVKQQIAGTIPDSLFIKHRSKGSAKELFNTLAGEFERKSRMVSVDLRRCLQEEKCGKKDDICTNSLYSTPNHARGSCCHGSPSN